MSRSDARSTRLRRRPSRTVPATIVAVVITAIGALTAVAAIARLVTGSWTPALTGPAATAGHVTWGSTTAVVAGATVVVVGLVLLITALKPGAHTSARLDPGATGVVPEHDFVISTRALARIATAHADTVDGVETVSASSTAQSLRLRVTTVSEQTDVVRAQVVDAVTAALRAGGVQPLPRVSATVRTQEI